MEHYWPFVWGIHIIVYRANNRAFHPVAIAGTTLTPWITFTSLASLCNSFEGQVLIDEIYFIYWYPVLECVAVARFEDREPEWHLQ